MAGSYFDTANAANALGTVTEPLNRATILKVDKLCERATDVLNVKEVIGLKTPFLSL